MSVVRVVGAGLSGLAAARVLADTGHHVQVIEARSEPGGMVGSTQTPLGLVERAANAFVWDITPARWFERLRITPLLAKPESGRRYFFADGRARRWPLGLHETAAMAGRLTAAKLRGRLRPAPDESVAAFGARVAGPAAVRKLIGPALQGVHAAPPTALSAEAIFKSGLPRRRVLAAPAGGMGQFIDRLFEDLRAHGVEFSFGRALDELDPSVRTVICCDTRQAAHLVAPHAPELAAAFSNVATTPLLSVTAFFEPHATDIQGFGVLFPRGCGVEALGCLFNACIFPGRSAVRSETWIYAAPASVATATRQSRDDEVARQVRDDRRVLTGRDTSPLAVVGSHHFPGLPVYGAGLAELARQLRACPPWLQFVGTFTGRIGVSSLLAAAERLSREA